MSIQKIQQEYRNKLELAGPKLSELSLKRLNRALKTLSACNQALIRLKEEQAILDAICTALVEHGGYLLAWVGYTDPLRSQTIHPVASFGLQTGAYPSPSVNGLEALTGWGPVKEAARRGVISKIHDVLSEPGLPAHLAEAARWGFRAIIAFPLFHDERLFGVLAVYSAEPNEFEEDEAGLLQELADDLAFGITNIWMRQARTQALKDLSESEERYRTLFESIQEGFALHEIILDENGKPHDYRFISINPAFQKITGLKAAQVIGRTVREVMPGIEQEWIDTYGEVAIKGITVRFENYSSVLGKHFEVHAFCPAKGQFGALFMDITERKQHADKIRQQFDRLNALRAIDLAITGSLDPRVTFNVLLTQVIEQLNLDAASILTLDKYSQTLMYTASKGFKTEALHYTNLRIGEGTAGKAALERKMIVVENLADNSNGFKVSASFKDENFVSYIAIPLITKGSVQGVLEVFNRTKLVPDQDWTNFLEALAGQAAIAIDNAILYDDMTNSNAELLQAYDYTLEGWARALELRDIETKGHSQRVSDKTLRLARELGFNKSDLVDLRRGALLHDIGKMGIPDAILNKPGKLNESEWEVMRRHPSYAYQMLAPIRYLHTALDIPHFHHERWDGTGYPMGLRGEEIPLAARIFSVIDVWDALISDRPYRKAWTEEAALDYIRQGAGRQFDPMVVEAFFKMMGELPR
jgi:PAS domain S-box-containing protein